MVYRPPPSSENGFTLSGFLEEFSYFVESYATSNTDCLLLGDFNFHVDVPADRSAQRFMSIFNDVNLQQHVAESTHMSGHTLDLVFSPVSSHLVSSTTVSTMMSDHCWVHMELNNKKPAWPLKDEIKFRKVNIDNDTFQRDILSSSLVLDPGNDCYILADMYHEQTCSTYQQNCSSQNQGTLVQR